MIVRHKRKFINIKDCISIFLFLIPFCYPFRKIIQRYIPVKEFLIVYLPTVLIMAYLLVRRRKFIVSSHLLLISLYSFFMLIPSPDHTTGIMWLINTVLSIFVTVVFSSKNFKIDNALPYCLGTVLCNFLLLPIISTKLGFYIYYTSYERIPFMYGDIDVGPNGWSQYLAVSIMLSVMQILYGEKNKTARRKKVLLLLLILQVLFLLLTAARGSLIALVVGFFLVPLLKSILDNRIIIKKSVVLKIGLLLIIASIIAVSYVYNNSSNLREKNHLADLSSAKRLQIWKMALHIFFNMNPLNILFGIGTGGTGVYLGEHNDPSFGIQVDDSYISHISAHNSYIDTLIALGVIGFLLFIAYWLLSILKILKYSNKYYYAVFPVFIMIAGLVYNLFSSWVYCACLAITEVIIIRECPQVHNQVRLLIKKNNILNVK